MTITPKTTVHTLLKEHPFLLDFLAGYHPEFKKVDEYMCAENAKSYDFLLKPDTTIAIP